jgi:hypothetical protein
VAQALVQAGNNEAARTALAATRAAAEEIGDDVRRVEALAAVARALAQAGDAAACTTAEGIEDDAARAEALAAVAQALVQAGNNEAARTVLAAARAAAEGIEDRAARAEALVGVAEALAQAEETDGASEALRDAFVTSLRGGHPGILVFLQDAAKALAAIIGVEALRRVAEAVIEVESWWSRPQ